MGLRRKRSPSAGKWGTKGYPAYAHRPALRGMRDRIDLLSMS